MGEGRIGEHELAVDSQVVEVYVVTLAGLANLLVCHAVKGAVLYVDVVDIVRILQAVEQYAVLGLLACDILHIDVAYRRYESALGLLAWLIHEVDAQHSLAASSHLNVTHEDILRYAAATGVGLDAQHAVKVRGVHLTVLGKDVLHACRNLRTEHHATVAVLHCAASYDDVLRWHVVLASVGITS